MGEAILKFSIPEEEDAFQRALNGPRYRAALEAILEWLRSQRKHVDHGAEAQELLEEYWEKCWDALSAEGINEEF